MFKYIFLSIADKTRFPMLYNTILIYLFIIRFVCVMCERVCFDRCFVFVFFFLSFCCGCGFVSQKMSITMQPHPYIHWTDWMWITCMQFDTHQEKERRDGKSEQSLRRIYLLCKILMSNCTQSINYDMHLTHRLVLFTQAKQSLIVRRHQKYQKRAPTQCAFIWIHKWCVCECGDRLDSATLP